MVPTVFLLQGPAHPWAFFAGASSCSESLPEKARRNHADDKPSEAEIGFILNLTRDT